MSDSGLHEQQGKWETDLRQDSEYTSMDAGCSREVPTGPRSGGLHHPQSYASLIGETLLFGKTKHKPTPTVARSGRSGRAGAGRTGRHGRRAAEPTNGAGHESGTEAAGADSGSVPA